MKKNLVCLALVLALVLSSTAMAIYAIPEKYDLPIGDGSLKLSIYMSMEKGSETAMLTYDEHSAIIEWENRVGLDFTFVHPPENDDGTYFNMVVASGDLPDMFATGNWNSYYPGGVQGAIADGVLEDLNPYVEQYGYYYLTEANTNWDEQATKNFMTDDGMYRFGAASQRVPVLGKQHTGYGVRKDVLDELGIEVPNTITDFETMLIALKEYGFETPLATCKWGSGYWNSNAQLSASFGIKSNTYYVNDEGKVTHPYIEPAFKDYLTMLARWMELGLIDRDFISRTHADEKSMLTSGKSAVAAYGNWETNELIALTQVQDPDAMLVGMNTMAPEGQGGTFVNNFAAPIVNGENTMYWGISTNCENKVEAFKAFDYLYSYEGTELMVFGVEEDKDGNVIHWTNDDGTRQFSDYILNNPNLEYNSIRYVYTIQNLSAEYASEMEYMQYGSDACAEHWDAWTLNVNNSQSVPNMISLTADESNDRVTKMNDVESFILEKIYKIICNEDSIDNWDSYVEQIKAMGIEDCIAVTQAAYERYQAR